ncbi:hypothetical protein R1flu_009310 [Riccia fluitans]|uniref:Uncharacterized protein n=1 Tax=Riccia fluitans TaxID=41844 RepID=A0ABD1Z1W0_9MARC
MYYLTKLWKRSSVELDHGGDYQCGERGALDWWAAQSDCPIALIEEYARQCRTRSRTCFSCSTRSGRRGLR